LCDDCRDEAAEAMRSRESKKQSSSSLSDPGDAMRRAGAFCRT
jgi:hypothetical protein